MYKKAYIAPFGHPLNDNGKTYLYNVQVWNSLDGENYSYCGEGRYCETLTEVKDYAKSVEGSDDFTLQNPHIFTEEEWAKEVYAGTMTERTRKHLQQLYPGRWIGTLMHMRNEGGPTLVFEGLHFFIEGREHCPDRKS